MKTSWAHRACVAAMVVMACAGLTRAADEPAEPGAVQCANLVYANGKTSTCFANDFLNQIEQDTNVRTVKQFAPVNLESADLFNHPFAVWTGDGNFTLTQSQRDNLKDYLLSGGFIVASASCSSSKWNQSFEAEMKAIFPDRAMKTLDGDHPVFHTVYDITSSKYKSGEVKLPRLDGLEVDGKIVLIWSPDGLNDTAKAGPSCCCCGGNEVKSAKLINVNLLAYALTH